MGSQPHRTNLAAVDGRIVMLEELQCLQVFTYLTPEKVAFRPTAPRPGTERKRSLQSVTTYY
jgi:hypothetical protein